MDTHAELRTDEPNRTVTVETTDNPDSFPDTVYLWDSDTRDGVFVNALDLLKAIAEASGYKVTVEYTPTRPEPRTVVFNGTEED